MDRVAWWAGLLALASARVFDSCELARELQDYGVQRDHIATWVCIAFHESRLDTAAQNHGSGDHGIFQISELFWCGPGKACGVPCSAFRDDDIKDDIKCSLQIHEEHTRLQGNGFLAWVVYPQHCKQNTKKYLADCDGLSKYAAPKSLYKTNIVNRYEKNETAERSLSPDNRLQQDNFYRGTQKPSFLAISDIFQANFKYNFEQTAKPETWIDYKIKNVDDLKLPQFASRFDNPAGSQITQVPTTTTVRPIVPWRVIESNQLRNRIPKNGKEFERSSFDKNFGLSRYQFTSKIPKSPEPTSYLTIPTTTYQSHEALPTSVSYPKSTRTLVSYSFPNAHSTFNLQTTLAPLPRSSIKRVSFQREFALPSLTTRSVTREWTTSAPVTTSPYRTASRLESARPTQSVFDLYLNPTKRPQLPPFKFNSRIDSPYKIKIFLGGTTTHAPIYSLSYKG